MLGVRRGLVHVRRRRDDAHELQRVSRGLGDFAFKSEERLSVDQQMVM